MNNPFLSGTSDLLFVGHPRRKLHNDGLWWDIYTDPIIEALEDDHLLLEPLYRDGHFTPAKTKRLAYLDFLDLQMKVRDRFRLHNDVLGKCNLPYLHKLEHMFFYKFGVTVPITQMVEVQLAKRKAQLPLYEKLLRRVKPEAVIVTVSNAKRPLLEACQRADIPTAELQHGVVHEHHMVYSYPGTTRRARVFPNFVFAFGEFWRDAIEWPLPREHIIPVGFPYLEMQIRMASNIVKKNQILFISQSGPGEELSKFAVRLNSLLKEGTNIVFKLHPSEYTVWMQMYPWLNNRKITVVDSDEVSLYRLFAESQVQVGVKSTALYEGVGFDLPTYLVNQPGVEVMHPLLEKGAAKLVETPEEIAEDRSKEFKTTESASQFFSYDALENVENAINRVKRWNGFSRLTR